MNPPFDPYYHWLGIPPHEQPPNHYRLLSVQLFEPNLDVISNAADRLMMHLRTFQSGSHAAESQRLLNEISSARIRLLNPETKGKYDVQLQQLLQGASSAAQPVLPMPASQPLAVPVENAPIFVQPAATETIRVTTSEFGTTSVKRRSKKPGLELAKIVGGGLVGLAGATLILYFLGVDVLGLKAPGPTTKGGTTVAHVDPPKPTDKGADSKPTTSSIKNDGSSPGSSTTLLPKKSPSWFEKTPPEKSPPEKTPVTDSGISGSNDNRGARTSNERGENGQSITGDKPGLVASSGKLPDTTSAVAIVPRRTKTPPPSAEQQTEVRKQLEEIYKLSAAKTADEKVKLVRDLFKTGGEIQDNPGQRFVVFSRATELAQEAGDVGLMMQAIDKIGAEFEVDLLPMKESMLVKFAEKIRDDKSMDALIAVAKAVIEQAVAEDKFAVAVRVADATYTACQGTFGKKYRKFVFDGRNTLKIQQKKWEDAQDAIEKLKTAPDDPDANLAVGRWECLHKDQWTAGLPRLAKSSHEKLRDLAQRDLAQPAEVDAQVALADAWHELAKAGGDDLGACGRAYHWYLRAAERATGLTRAQVENGMKDVEKRWDDLVKSEVGRQPLAKSLSKPEAARPRDFADLAKQAPVGSGASSKNGNKKSKSSSGESVNVLSLITTSRDAMTGAWQLQNGNLVTPSGVDDRETGYKLKLPCEAASHYILTLEVARITTRGNLIIWLPAESGQKLAMLDGVKDNNPYSYVLGSNNRAGQILAKGVTVKIRIEVRGDLIDLSASAGGKTVRLAGSKSGEQNANGAPASFAIQSGGSFRISKIELETLP